MKRIAMIAAMKGEVKPLVRGWSHERRGKVDLWRSARNGCELVAACAGAGMAAANRAFQAVESCGPLSAVVSVGWVGALDDAHRAGEGYWCSGVLNVKSGERKEAVGGREARWLATSPKVADAAEKQRLAAAYGAALVDMEAFEIARLAELRGIPFLALKGVSDGFRDALPDFNRFLGPNGQMRMAALVTFALLHPAVWPALIRMGENSRRAARAMARELKTYLDEEAAQGGKNG